MKSKLKYIGIMLLISIFIILIGRGFGEYLLGNDTYFHFDNIKAIVEELSIKDIFVQKPLKMMAYDWGYGTRFFYPPLPHLLTAYIVKGLSIFGIRKCCYWYENHTRIMFVFIWDIIFFIM